MPICAAIDVGSNAVKLRVAERSTPPGGKDASPPATWRVLHDQFAITSLGRGLSAGGSLDPTASEVTTEQIVCFVGKARAFGATEPVLAGTMCLRLAADSEDFIARVREQTGLTLSVVTGHEEARLNYLALATSLPHLGEAVLAFDIGGGSTELMASEEGRLARDHSLDFGCLGITEKYLTSDPIPPAQVHTARRDIAATLAQLDGYSRPTHLVGIGATAATLATVAGATTSYAATEVHGQTVTRAEIEGQIELYSGLPVAERRRIPGLHPDRADVILAGAMITAAVMAHFAASELIVCAHDLRLGMLVDRFGTGTLLDD